MAAVPDRKTLETMKRIDLQRLCKDHGLRANLKSEALIDLLLSVAGPPKPSQIPQAKRNSSLRIVSRASSAGTRARGTSSSSVVIHDTDDEDTGGHESEPAKNVAGPSQARPPVSLPVRNTRKAKATQYRLGVGRPTVAGGSGARTVTRSLSVPKGKTSGKISRSVKPTEAAIQEEEEPESTVANDAPEPGPSGTPHDDPPAITSPEPPIPVSPMVVEPINNEPPAISSDMSEGLKAYLMTIVNPLREQISTLQSELQQATSRLTYVAPLEARVSELSNEVNILKGQASRSNHLETEVATLKEQIAMLKVGPIRSRTETAASGKSRLTDQTAVSPTPQAGPSNLDTYFAQQGLPASLLGKRGRGTKDDGLPGTVEADKESDLSPATLATQVVRPSKKRAKLGEYGVLTATVTPAAEVEEDEEELEPPPRPPSGPGFTVFTGPEEPLDDEMDPPPPTTRLSDLVGISSSSNPHSISPVTSSAHANENQPMDNPFTFNFNFHEAITSTPAPTSYEAGAFTFGGLPPSLPAPTSPTPGGDPGPSSLYEGRPAGRRAKTGSEMYGNLGHGNRPRGPAAAGASLVRPPSRSQQAGPSGLGLRGTPDPLADQCISPAELLRPRTPTRGLSAIPEDRDNDHNPHINPSRQRASGLTGSTLPTAGMPPETPAPPMKRTMYGTEVDQDTRFGDFGYEGVAMGFWTGAVHF